MRRVRKEIDFETLDYKSVDRMVEFSIPNTQLKSNVYCRVDVAHTPKTPVIRVTFLEELNIVFTEDTEVGSLLLDGALLLPLWEGKSNTIPKGDMLAVVKDKQLVVDILNL